MDSDEKKKKELTLVHVEKLSILQLNSFILIIVITCCCATAFSESSARMVSSLDSSLESCTLKKRSYYQQLSKIYSGYRFYLLC